MSENILALANPMLSTVFALAFFILWRRDPSATWIAIIAVGYFSSALGFFIFHFTFYLEEQNLSLSAIRTPL